MRLGSSTGEIQLFIDGQPLGNPRHLTAGARFLEKRAVVMLGARCTTSSATHYRTDRRSTCDLFKTRIVNFHGELDDVRHAQPRSTTTAGKCRDAA